MLYPKLVSRIRKFINPPYSLREIFSIIGLVIILVAIPLTVISTQRRLSVGSRAETGGANKPGDLLNLINQYRVSKGLGALVGDQNLTNAACWFAGDMATKNYAPTDHKDSLGRNPVARTAAFGINTTYIGENLFFGGVTPKEVIDGWKGSPGHNEILLNSRFTRIGLALAYDKNSHWGQYWVADFADRSPATGVTSQCNPQIPPPQPMGLAVAAQRCTGGDKAKADVKFSWNSVYGGESYSVYLWDPGNTFPNLPHDTSWAIGPKVSGTSYEWPDLPSSSHWSWTAVAYAGAYKSGIYAFGPEFTAVDCRGSIQGRVFRDDNGNAKFDINEAVVQNTASCSGAVTLSGVSINYGAGTVYPNKCNPSPYFSTDLIPLGPYNVSVSTPSGWWVVGSTLCYNQTDCHSSSSNPAFTNPASVSLQNPADKADLYFAISQVKVDLTRGDVDCDGDKDAVDALFILRHVAALPITNTKCTGGGIDLTKVDVFPNSQIDSVDALFVLRMVAGLISQSTGKATSLYVDSDRDLMTDSEEITYSQCLNSNLYDSKTDPDNDGLFSVDELVGGTNPCKRDTDGDGFSDKLEYYVGTSPKLNCASTSTANDELDDAWPADFDDNRYITTSDVSQVSNYAGKIVGKDPFLMRRDLDMNGTINSSDTSSVSARVGKTCNP